MSDAPVSPAVTPSTPVPQARPTPRTHGFWDRCVTVSGMIVAIWAAALLAVVGAFLTPARVGGWLAPISLPLVIVGTAGLTWFAFRWTGRRGAALLPGLMWLVVSFAGADRTAEGDLVLAANNWVATAYLIVGSAAIAVTAYVLFLRPRRAIG